MPEANNFTIGLFALIAQNERETISLRTKAALQAKKERGCKLGVEGSNNLIKGNASAKGVAATKLKAAINPNNVKAIAFAQSLQKNGLSVSQISRSLNESGFCASRGGNFTPKQVSQLLKSVPV